MAGRAPRKRLPRGRWWELYGDPELDALEAQVALNNQTLLARPRRACGRRRRRSTSPARRASSRLNAVQSPTNRVGASPQAGSPTCGAASGAASRRARRPTQASAADLAEATLSVQAQLAQNYFLLRVQDAQIRLLQDSATGYERSLQLTRNQYAAGIVARGDVVQAEAQLKSTQAQALDAKSTRAARARDRRAGRQAAGRFRLPQRR